MGPPARDAVGRRRLVRAWDRYWSGAAHGDGGPGRFTRWAVPLLKAGAVGSVVDLGCGAGRDLCYLVRQGFRVTGVDISPAAIERSRAALARGKLGGTVRLLEADPRAPLSTVATGSVDAVHAAASYQGLSPTAARQLFREVRRVLRPDGWHVWSIRGERHPGRAQPGSVPPNVPSDRAPVRLRFPSVQAVARLEAVGFRRVELRVVEPHAFYVADRRRP